MAMATTAGSALAGAGVAAAAVQLAPVQPAFTLDPDFPVFDGGAVGGAVGPLPPLPPLYQVDAAVVSGKADTACFAVEVAVDLMHAAVWDKRTSKPVAVNLDPREPAMVWSRRSSTLRCVSEMAGPNLRLTLVPPHRRQSTTGQPTHTLRMCAASPLLANHGFANRTPLIGGVTGRRTCRRRAGRTVRASDMRW